MRAKHAVEATGLHTVAEAQDILKCSRQKIYNLAKEGRLELVKFDRATRVTDRSLQHLLRETIATPKPENAEQSNRRDP